MKHTRMHIDAANGNVFFQFSNSEQSTIQTHKIISAGIISQTSGDSEKVCDNGSECINNVGPSLLSSLIEQYPDVICDSIGTARVQPYDIILADNTPVRRPPYQLAPDKMFIMRRVINDLLQSGVIRKSVSNWSSPAFCRKSRTVNHIVYL